MSEKSEKCWICGDAATTGEHLIKVSDLKSIFGDISQEDPIFFHTADQLNLPLGSLKAKSLKSSAKICNNCNSARTQPHDKAWSTLSHALRSCSPPLAPGQIIRANRIFNLDTTKEMLNVHLYFVKVFGCKIVENGAPIDITGFSKAIMSSSANPNVFLAFGTSSWANKKIMAGQSEMKAIERDGRCQLAMWFHHVGNLVVRVTYAANGIKQDELPRSWHPTFSRNRFRIENFSKNESKTTAPTVQN